VVIYRSIYEQCIVKFGSSVLQLYWVKPSAVVHHSWVRVRHGWGAGPSSPLEPQPKLANPWGLRRASGPRGLGVAIGLSPTGQNQSNPAPEVQSSLCEPVGHEMDALLDWNTERRSARRWARRALSPDCQPPPRDCNNDQKISAHISLIHILCSRVQLATMPYVVRTGEERTSQGSLLSSAQHLRSHNRHF